MRLRLLTAGLLLLRAAGGTAEDAATAAAAAREGGGGGGGSGGGGASVDGGGGFGAESKASAAAATDKDDSEEMAEKKLSLQARLKLLRRASGTLAELEALEESLRARGGDGSGVERGRGARDKRRPGLSISSDGMLEAEGDRTLRANLAGVCVAIVEEMTVPRGYLGGDAVCAGGGGGERRLARGGGDMAYAVEGIVREEKVRVVFCCCCSGYAAV